MKRFSFVATLLFALVAGCASTGPTNVAPAVAPEPPPAQTLTAVHVPTASAKRVVLDMTGPKTSTDARDWTSFKEEWRATFAEHAKDAGITFEMRQGDATPAAAGTLLKVYVNDYRMVGIGSRIFFGVMTGNAYIDSTVTFVDLSSGETVGVQAYITTSSAWAGVFAKMTPQQVDAIAADVFREFRPR